MNPRSRSSRSVPCCHWFYVIRGLFARMRPRRDLVAGRPSLKARFEQFFTKKSATAPGHEGQAVLRREPVSWSGGTSHR